MTDGMDTLPFDELPPYRHLPPSIARWPKTGPDIALEL